MTRVVLPGELASSLFGCKSRTPLCNEEGVVIGFFEPAISQDGQLYEWLSKEVPTQELDEAARDGGNATTAEVFARLEVIDKSQSNVQSKASK